MSRYCSSTHPNESGLFDMRSDKNRASPNMRLDCTNCLHRFQLEQNLNSKNLTFLSSSEQRKINPPSTIPPYKCMKKKSMTSISPNPEFFQKNSTEAPFGMKGQGRRGRENQIKGHFDYIYKLLGNIGQSLEWLGRTKLEETIKLKPSFKMFLKKCSVPKLC